MYFVRRFSGFQGLTLRIPQVLRQLKGQQIQRLQQESRQFRTLLQMLNSFDYFFELQQTLTSKSSHLRIGSLE
jgi:hypothetical protein